MSYVTTGGVSWGDVKKVITAAGTVVEYGPQIVELIKKYGPEIERAIKQYGPVAIEYLTKYGPQAAAAIQQYGPQAVALGEKYLQTGQQLAETTKKTTDFFETYKWPLIIGGGGLAFLLVLNVMKK